MTERLNERDIYFDNLKFVLILLVVVGHFIEPFNFELTTGAVYQWIYSFHMPLFIFVSGYFCKNISYPKYYVNLVSTLLVPYIIFQTLYTLFDYYTLGLERLNFTYFYPYWILWFLFSMMLWKKLLPYLLILKYPLAICIVISLMMGYALDVGYYASISRTLYFFPFFMMGLYFKREWLDTLKTRRNQIISLAALVLGFTLMYILSPVMHTSWFFGSLPYVEFGIDTWYAAGYRLMTYVFTICMGLAVLIMVPGSRLPFTRMGEHTMYVFLLHGFLVKTMLHYGWFEAFDSALGKVLLVVIGTAVTFTLSSSWIKRGFRWIVEPNVQFLIKNRVRFKAKKHQKKEEF